MALDDDVEKFKGETAFTEKTELGEVFDNLDNDTMEKETRMSNIDFNTRLIDTEINCIMIIDELTRLHILPAVIGITRQKKRLAVSLHGKGREEKVRIVQGERENKTGAGVMGRLGGLFNRRE